jgi:hypothetical protein
VGGVTSREGGETGEVGLLAALVSEGASASPDRGALSARGSRSTFAVLVCA